MEQGFKPLRAAPLNVEFICRHQHSGYGLADLGLRQARSHVAIAAAAVWDELCSSEIAPRLIFSLPGAEPHYLAIRIIA